MEIWSKIWELMIKIFNLIPKKWIRILELFLTVFFCAGIAYIYFHYLYDVPYSRVLGLFLAWLVYKIVKFISIRNKKLFIINY